MIKVNQDQATVFLHSVYQTHEGRRSEFPAETRNNVHSPGPLPERITDSDIREPSFETTHSHETGQSNMEATY